jgi:lysophospholipase L1-like esterase
MRSPHPVVAVALAALAIGGCAGGGKGAGGADGVGFVSGIPPGTPAGKTRAVPPPGPGSVLVAALGDSITAGAPQWDPNPEVRRRIDPGILDPHNQWEYWAQRRNGRLAFRNCGVDGERTDQMERRLAACADGATVLVIQGGLNDIAQGRSVGSVARNLRRMIREGKRLGAMVMTVELLPWNNGWPRAAATILALNRRIHLIARAERVPVLPWYRTLEDPRAPGRMRPGLTTDGSHPSVAGHQKLGALFRFPPPPV